MPKANTIPTPDCSAPNSIIANFSISPKTPFYSYRRSMLCSSSPMAPPRANPPFPRKKVAIVGSGCAGIAALWALNRSPHDVYLYEAANRLGGHTNTVEFSKGKYKTMVDTGFIVMNSATYRTVPAVSFLRSWLTRGSQLYQLPQQDQCQD